MKIYRRALILTLSMLLCVLAFVPAGCGETGSGTSSDGGSATPDSAPEATGGLADLGIDPKSVGVLPDVTHDEKNEVGFQIKPPEEGDTIAVIHTSMGDITLRFFPDQAPKTVTNFINLAKAGEYNKTVFHTVVAESLIQGGFCGDDENNPNGVSSYGAPFEDEFCDTLFNIRGAVAMANSAKDSNGSQFLINQTTAAAFRKKNGWRGLQTVWRELSKKLIDYKDSELLSAYIDENGDRLLDPSVVPDNVKKLYLENGGNPNLDGAYNAVDRGCTVFAQVIGGMDVVDKITAVKADEHQTPKEPVTISSVEITTYQPAAAAK